MARGAATVTIILAGATVGFLCFNFHPASIFLGDSGSLFLGFMLAGIGLLGSQKSPTVIAVAIPIVSLGLPVLDTTLAVARRFLRGQPIFTADRAHIHHRLLSLGISPRRVALLLYSACALLGLSGMLLVNDSAYVAVVLLVIGLGVGIAVQRLSYYEFEELCAMLRRGVRQRKVIRRNVRIREASVRVSDLTDLDHVFEASRRRSRRTNSSAPRSAPTVIRGSRCRCRGLPKARRRRAGVGVASLERDARRAGKFASRFSHRRVSALARSCSGRTVVGMT
jgi:hypothetical protein